ncbi:MAG: tetratricopeptide repeat protein [Bryobacteraceae bacterium]|nr:tetratricopeptide repeat protein [Bryobacteraceae bacterium]
MTSDRIEALRQMLISDIGNTFARYGLAMELFKSGDTEAAVREFEVLREQNPDYSAAYYHGGRALQALGRIAEARELMEQGIVVTTRTGDHHTRSELQAAIDLLDI